MIGLFIESEKDTSKRTVSIKECVTAYEVFVKHIADIDDSGSSLMGKAFSFTDDKYPPIQVSGLRDDSGRNLQEGIKLMSMGMMKALRNINIHATAKDNVVGMYEALNMLSTVSLLWQTIDNGLIEALSKSTDFNESKQLSQTFERLRAYYKKQGIDYPDIPYKNALLKGCTMYSGLINGYVAHPILRRFIDDNKNFIGSKECTLLPEEKDTLYTYFK